mgnify:CR=1 FL=1
MGERDPTATIPHPTLSHLLIIGSDDGTISIWDLQERVCLAQSIGHQHEILALKIVANPLRLVSCSVDGSLKVWGLQDTRLTELCSIDFGTPYQDLQLSAVKGLNRSQLDTLVQLGALK